MSGGSFGYLMTADPEDLLWRRAVVRNMAEFLVEIGVAAPAVAALVRYADLLDGYAAKIGRVHAELYDLMHAAEWTASGDWGTDDLLGFCAGFVPPADPGIPVVWACPVCEMRSDGTHATIHSEGCGHPCHRPTAVADAERQDPF